MAPRGELHGHAIRQCRSGCYGSMGRTARTKSRASPTGRLGGGDEMELKILRFAVGLLFGGLAGWRLSKLRASWYDTTLILALLFWIAYLGYRAK